MKNKAFSRLTVISLMIALINLAAALAFIPTLPDNVPTHFNASMVCDRMDSKWFAIGIPLIQLILFPIGIFFTARSKNAEKNIKPTVIVLAFIDLMFVGLNMLMLVVMSSGVQLGEKVDFDIAWLIPLMVGVIFVVIGNYLPVVRQNETLGIKLPWTLKNEKCWDVTHRFTGKLYVAVGLLMIAAMVTMKLTVGTSDIVVVASTLLSVFLASVPPTIYAYKHRNAK